MAAEFFGTCQICGREQKAHPHAIAKHGYTIRFGWQMGECFGSGAKPYEISNDRILAAIDAAKAYIERTKGDIEKLQASPYDADGMVWAKAAERRYDESRLMRVTLGLSEKGAIEAKDQWGRVVYLDMAAAAETIDEAARALAVRQMAALRRAIAEAETSIPYLQARHDAWKPAELRPVTPADRDAKAIKVHMAVKRYGRTTGICVASASGAQAYKMTTEDRAKVTCAACLKELARLDDLPRLRAEKAEKDRLAGIKEAEREIKSYQKLIRGGGSDENMLYWARMLNEETTRLEALRAQAPAQASDAA